MEHPWTSNLFFSIKLLESPNFMGYNARIRILEKRDGTNMQEIGVFNVNYAKLLPEFFWESGRLDLTQKEFLELRAQAEVEKAIYETKSAPLDR